MTDRDRFANVIDSRYRKHIYPLTSRASDAYLGICDYIERREREAAGDSLAQTYATADRLLQRQALLLLADHDPQIAQLDERGRASFPEARLLAAFHDAEQTGGDLAEIYASRQLRWLIGAVTADDEVCNNASFLEEIRPQITAELAERSRERYLGIPRSIRPIKQDAGDIVHEQIPFADD